MDQQAARGAISDPHTTCVLWSDWRRTAVTTAILGALCLGLLALPTPQGLSSAGQRVLAVAAIAIGLWSTDVLPMGLTSMVVVVLLALNSVNRLASTVLLTGGITPITAAALIGGISWTRWLVLMCVPYYAILTVGAALIYGLYGRGFGAVLPVPQIQAQMTLVAYVMVLLVALPYWSVVGEPLVVRSGG